MNMRKRKIVWGITGAGDLLDETLGVMKGLKEAYDGKVEIEVYLSKAGEQVLQFYRLGDKLRSHFRQVHVEKDANTPFITGRLHLGRFDFLILAPATSNTVAKIAHGISDTLLTNSAIQALKACVPVYLMPVDYMEGAIVTTLPNGNELELRVRKEDAENVVKVSEMDGIIILKKPEEIEEIFDSVFGVP
ncbi:MAG: archaeoflavoprotein AfpA [Candidatus Bathyarchaeota archaeon]|nr:archaeoflavoprotein AfpA [Candidatus Bathyarchaeota archaeon]